MTDVWMDKNGTGYAVGFYTVNQFDVATWTGMFGNTTRNLNGAIAMLEGVIDASHSKQAMIGTFASMLSGFIPMDGGQISLFWTVGEDTVLGPVGWDEAEARAVIESMIQAPGEQVRPDGDMVRTSEQGEWLITIPESDNRPQAVALIRSEGLQPPTRVIMAIHGFLRNFAALWPRAAD